MGDERDHRPARVSVVIPCYNQGRFLAEALDSVLGQTEPPDEVVVVDDGSTDDTCEVAGRYPKVRLLRQENRGVSVARNTGLAASRGELLVFVDADDRLCDDALAVQAAHLRADSRLALVAGGCEVMESDGSLGVGPSRADAPVTAPPEVGYAALLEGCLIWTPAAAMVRRAALDAVGAFDARLRGAQDFDLYLRIARRFPIRWHGRAVASYRRHAGSTSSDPILMWSDVLDIYRSHWSSAVHDGRWETAWRVGLKRAERSHAAALLARTRAAFHDDPRHLGRALTREARPSDDRARLRDCIYELARARLLAEEGSPVALEVPPREERHDAFDRLVLDIHAELLAEALEYGHTVRRVRELVAGPLDGEVVAVLSRGDDSLVEWPGRRLVHFPSGHDGRWSGYHPASSEDAVVALEDARRRGATALVVPAPSRWWLSHYETFAAHLASITTEVVEAAGGTLAFRFPAPALQRGGR